MNIVIIDTGCANLFSLKYAIQRLGYNPVITKNIKMIEFADKLLLPGVGTPISAMEQLHKFDLVTVIKNFKKPILGICLGMQLFCLYSQECNRVKMLGIINSVVVKLTVNKLSIPHMGWNTVISYDQEFLFRGIKPKSKFYFVHSYMLEMNKYTIAYSDYGGYFSAVIRKKNFFGVQFHPEKSGFVGAQLLKNFLEIGEYDYSSNRFN
ncbi:imidazole glycerol phosphate synthase subunit HisH [Buchnera aphidicola]|uniref:imidazole glycerol phosphate synthase subunit HisH n=1 Tax=Buchnera aphidicola TaxID=9 RepID=UPI0031B811AA